MKQIEMFASQGSQAPSSRLSEKPKEFSKAPVEIPCVDKWPPFALSSKIMQVYKIAEDEGIIHIDSIKISKSTASAVITYRSTIPIEWVHQRLKEAKNIEAQ